MAIATVISITGQAWARDAEGNLRELRVGDTLREGEALVTSDNGSAQLDFGDGLDPTLVESGEQVVMVPELNADEPADASEFAALDEDLEALLAALDDDSVDLLDVLDATAAGAGPGGAADGGHSFVRLARIAEDVNPLAFSFGMNALGGPPEEQGGPLLLAEAEEEVEEPQLVVTPPSAGSFEATLLDVETLSESGSVMTGTLPFSFGNGENGSITFASMHGVESQVGQEIIIYSWDASTNTLTAFSPARELNIFTIEVNPATGEITLTQVNNLLHEEGMDEALTSLIYTVTSSSGTTSGTLNITIVDDVPGVELGSVDLSGLELTTLDAETVNDTSTATGSVTTAFTSAVTASYGADGAGNVVVDGYALSLGEVEHSLTSGGEPIVFTLEDGVVIGTADGVEVLRIEIDADSRKVSVTQSQPLDHSGAGADSLSLPAGLVSVSATVTVTDSDGDTATDTLTVDLGGSISILDDVPLAQDVEGGLLVEDAVVNELSGNVLADDQPGADGFSSLMWNVSAEQLAEIGQYGTLVLNTDGSWSFTLDNSLAAVQALNADDLLDFELGYTITDADGDTASATLSLSIQGADDSAEVIVNAEGADSIVHEAGLTSGADTRESASGSFQVAATDGIASVTVGGQSFTLTELQGFSAGTPSAGISTTKGTLYLTGYSGTATSGTVSYLYELSEAQTHGATGSATDEVLTDSVSLSVTGVGGSAGSATLTIDVIDDVPVAADNAGGTVTEDAAEDVLNGNVLENDSFGADGPAGGTASVSWNVSAEQLAEIGQYGTLVLNTDGSWNFTLDSSLAAVQALNADDLLDFELGYTITDADGDTASATLSLSIQGADDSAEVIVNAEGADSIVHEAGLTSGADTRESASGSFQVAATDGIASVTVGGQSFTLAELQGFSAGTPSAGISTTKGTLYLTGYSGTATSGTVSYLYELSEAQTHGVTGSATDEVLTDSVSLSVTGVGGSTAEATLTVDIIDDTPSLSSLNLAIGNVAGTYDGIYEFDVGADAQGFLDSFGEGSLIWTGMPAGYELAITGSSDTSITYTAQSGSFEFFNLTLYANGTYSFELVSPAPVVETEIESLLSAFDPDGFYKEGGKDAYLFSADVFDGKFELAIEAFSDGNRENVSLSSTDLGVRSNVVQGNKKDMLRFDVRPVDGAEAVGISSFVFSVSGTGGTKAGDQAKLTVYDVDGSFEVYTATLVTADGEFVFDIDPSHNVDYMELRPAGNNSFKVDGISTSYVTQIYPDDYQLDFELSGSDADGDLAIAAFTVSVKTTEDGTYEITGTDGDDVVHGTEGDDILIGGAGNDTLIGGEGDDVFQWNLGDQGDSDAPAHDTVMDFGLGEDVLDLADLLQSESAESIDSFIFAAQEGTSTVLYVNHQGGISTDGSNAAQVIVLENFSMDGADSAQFLEEMLNNGQLNIDQ